MKTLASLFGGAVVLTEQGGVFSLTLDKSASIGGGSVAGIVKVSDSGNVELSGAQLLQIAQAALNAHLSGTALAIAEGAEAIADPVIAAEE